MYFVLCIMHEIQNAKENKKQGHNVTLFFIIKRSERKENEFSFPSERRYQKV
ncbi:MAG: hypothetical protein UT03_C0014G0002 [Candidatus Moranbacteria bacterium GW2011_GWD2_38_7]|nr:MAG: hypothetical protein UT03_C0014G0002 [Candidatus Moranbacteria bacterium GW2011_GWD2_38_7]